MSFLGWEIFYRDQRQSDGWKYVPGNIWTFEVSRKRSHITTEIDNHFFIVGLSKIILYKKYFTNY